MLSGPWVVLCENHQHSGRIVSWYPDIAKSDGDAQDFLGVPLSFPIHFDSPLSNQDEVFSRRSTPTGLTLLEPLRRLTNDTATPIEVRPTLNWLIVNGLNASCCNSMPACGVSYSVNFDLFGAGMDSCPKRSLPSRKDLCHPRSFRDKNPNESLLLINTFFCFQSSFYAGTRIAYLMITD